MTAASRIARRLVRKLAKPLALWLIERQARACEAEANRLMEMRSDLALLELTERRHQVVLAARRREISNW